jgi:hypothetical protein
VAINLAAISLYQIVARALSLSTNLQNIPPDVCRHGYRY